MSPPGVLTLPDVAAAIPGNFTIQSSRDSGLTAAALTLADMEVLRPVYWVGEPALSLSKAFTELGCQHWPQPLADWAIHFEDDIENDKDAGALAWDDGHYDSYRACKKLPEDTPVGALTLTFNTDKTVHRVIGPAIRALEKVKPGLGQSALYWFNRASCLTYRALDPIEGYGWCQRAYWMGENDETMRVGEEIHWYEGQHKEKQKVLPAKDRKPFNREAAIADMGIFTRAMYDQAIPDWAGSRFKPKPKLAEKEILKLAKHSVTRHSSPVTRHRRILNAVLEVIRVSKGADLRLNDAGHFNRCRSEATPYLIRWHCPSNDRGDQDPLARVFDDTMNEDLYQGEDLPDVNAVFAWHDQASLRDAVKRFIRFMQIGHAADQLLLALAPKPL